MEPFEKILTKRLEEVLKVVLVFLMEGGESTPSQVVRCNQAMQR